MSGHDAGTRPATTKDVAARAGVSVGTVSHTLNKPHLVSAAARRRVEDAIAELGFVPNESARHLRSGRSRLIAMTVPDLTNPFFDEVAAGADDAADAAGAMVVVCNSAGSGDRERRHLQRLSGQRLLGLIISPLQEPSWPLVAELTDRGTPVVFLDYLPTDPGPASSVATVSADDHLGGHLVGEHLRQRGHRRTTFVAPDFQQTRARLAGLRQGIGSDVHVEVRQTPDTTLEDGIAAAADLFATPAQTWPSAVVCGNDLLAMGVLHECRRRGIRVPQDLALVGYDDIVFASSASVPLTTVRQPRAQMGRAAVDLVLARATGRDSVTFRPELVVRDSTSAVTTRN